MDKEEILDAIRAEWFNTYGKLTECDEEYREKFYFVLGFVSAAIDSATKYD